MSANGDWFRSHGPSRARGRSGEGNLMVTHRGMLPGFLLSLTFTSPRQILLCYFTSAFPPCQPEAGVKRSLWHSLLNGTDPTNSAKLFCCLWMNSSALQWSSTIGDYSYCRLATLFEDFKSTLRITDKWWNLTIWKLKWCSTKEANCCVVELNHRCSIKHNSVVNKQFRTNIGGYWFLTANTTRENEGKCQRKISYACQL